MEHKDIINYLKISIVNDYIEIAKLMAKNIRESSIYLSAESMDFVLKYDRFEIFKLLIDSYLGNSAYDSVRNFKYIENYICSYIKSDYKYIKYANYMMKTYNKNYIAKIKKIIENNGDDVIKTVKKYAPEMDYLFARKFAQNIPDLRKFYEANESFKNFIIDGERDYASKIFDNTILGKIGGKKEEILDILFKK